jgi:L-xylulokinase
MMSEYFLGIDNGGTIIKAVVFDEQGTEIAGASRKVPVLNPQPGFFERDMEVLWKANLEAISEAVLSSGLSSGQIKGVACAGHGKGLYLWGYDDKPAYNGIMSTDSRAIEYSTSWAKNGVADRVFLKTYQSVLASQPVSILRWFKDHRPEIVKNTKWIFEVKDYIRFRLTGEPFAEVTDYSGSSLMNLRDRCFEADLLAEFGLEDILAKLPPLKDSTDTCGSISEKTSSLTGLRPGTPVSGGMFDIDACSLAVDVTDEHNLCVIAGTWSINEYLSRKPVMNHSVMMNSLSFLPGYFLVEECSPTSAGNNEWFINLFLQAEEEQASMKGVPFYEHVSQMAGEVAPDGQNIIFLPYLYGSNYDPKAKACFVGLESSHTRSQIVRAVFEGIVFCHMVHIEKLLSNRKAPGVVRLAGGAAKSRVWSQIFADVLAIPVETVEAAELGALGCAIIASVTSGVYPDLKTAAKRMVKVGQRYEPNPKAVEIYRRKYKSYLAVASALEDLWKDFPSTLAP